MPEKSTPLPHREDMLAEYLANQIVEGSIPAGTRLPSATEFSKEISQAWQKVTFRNVQRVLGRLAEAGLTELRGRHYYAMTPPPNWRIPSRDKFADAVAHRRAAHEKLATAAGTIAGLTTGDYPPGTRVFKSAEFIAQNGITESSFSSLIEPFITQGLLESRRGPKGGFFTTVQSTNTELVNTTLKELLTQLSHKIDTPRKSNSALSHGRSIPLEEFSALHGLSMSRQELLKNLHQIFDRYKGTWRLPPQQDMQKAMGIGGGMMTYAMQQLKAKGLLSVRAIGTDSRGTYVSQLWNRNRYIRTYARSPLKDQAHQVAFDIRSLIDEGLLLSDEPLPERESLRDFYQYNQTVIDNALRILKEENRIVEQDLVSDKQPLDTDPAGLSPLARQISQSINSGDIYPGAIIRIAAIQRLHNVNRVEADVALRQLIGAKKVTENPNGRSWVVIGDRSDTGQVDRELPDLYAGKKTDAYVTKMVADAFNSNPFPKLPKKERFIHAVAALILANQLAPEMKFPSIHDLVSAIPDIGKKTIDNARKELIRANFLRVEKMTEGTFIRTEPYKVDDCFVDKEIVDKWQRLSRFEELKTRYDLTTSLVADIRACIAETNLVPGSPLPGKASLQAIYGVRAGVITNAVYQLLGEGLLTMGKAGLITLVARKAQPYVFSQPSKRVSPSSVTTQAKPTPHPVSTRLH